MVAFARHGFPVGLLALALTFGSSLPTSAQSVVATIPVSTSPQSVDVNPVTNRVYVSTGVYPAQSGVSVINGGNNSVVATIPLTGTTNVGNPIAVNSHLNLIYVAQPGFTFGNEGVISVINGQTNKVSATITQGEGPGPIGVGVNQVTNRIYAPLQSRSTYLFGAWSGSTNAQIAQNSYIPAALPFSDQVAVNQLTNRIYLADGAVFSGTTNLQIGSLPVNGNWIAVNPRTNRVYETDANNGTLIVMDGGNDAIIHTIIIGNHPAGIAVNPNTNRVYVAVSGSNSVAIVDGSQNTLVTNVPVGHAPLSLAVNPQTNRIYVANSLDNTISVISD